MHSSPMILGLALLASTVAGGSALAAPRAQGQTPPRVLAAPSPRPPVAFLEIRPQPARPRPHAQSRRAPFTAGRPEVMSLTDENEVARPAR